MAYYKAGFTCEDCNGDYEVDDLYWDSSDIPENWEVIELAGGQTTEVYGDILELCEECSYEYSYCDYCDRTFPNDDMYCCDDGEHRCEGCVESHHENVEAQMEDEGNREEEWICKECNVSNDNYMSEPVASWTL